MLRRTLAAMLLVAAPAFAQVQETIEVTATRIAEDVLIVPASVTVIDGNELRARNATDLASALALVAGVNALGGSDPQSPHVRQGPRLTLLTPIGANHNPEDAHIDENRIQLTGGWSNEKAGVTLAFRHSDFDIKRGFLTALNENDPNAAGFSQDREVNDIYFDAHMVLTPMPNLRAIAGVDHLYGNAGADNDRARLRTMVQLTPAPPVSRVSVCESLSLPASSSPSRCSLV